MSSHTLPTFEVPTVDEMPPPQERSFDVVGYTDFLLNSLLQDGHAGLLHADLHGDAGRWRLRTWSSQTEATERVIATLPEEGRFRAVLAHLGVRFMNGKVYGGFAEGFLANRGTERYFAMYTANDGLRGYWLRVYVRS